MSHKRATEALIGQQVVVTILGANGPTKAGEFEKAKWKVQTEVKKRKPLGFKLNRNKLIVHGWEGELERGVIDANIVQLVMAEWAAVLKGEPEVLYAIDVTENYANGDEHVMRFRNVMFPDFEWESGGADEFVFEKLKWEAEDMELEVNGQKTDPSQGT